jgi:hypothetical protein
MPRLAPLFALVGLLLLAASPAAAQSRRAARAVGLFVERPALLVRHDRAFVAEAPEGIVSVCAQDSGACRGIERQEPCRADRCPGSGVLLHLAGDLGDVGDYPTDRDGIEREWNAVAADPRIASLASALTRPGPPPPPPSFHLRNGQWRFEGALGGGAAVRGEGAIALGTFFGALGMRVGYDWDREEALEILFGSSVGADVRVRVLPSVLGGPFEQASVAVGFGPSATFAPAGEPWRLGAGYFSVLPELGVITRPDLDPAFYFGWSFPFSVALDTHVGIETRLWAWIVDDWVEGDDVGFVGGIDASLLFF